MLEKDLVLGKKYRDAVSGWEGVATAKYEFMNGCTRICLAASKDGEPKEYVFDIEQIQPVEAPPVERSRPSPTGGPRDTTPVERAGP